MSSDYCIAIVLAAGRGKRMNSSVQKQFLHIKGRPLIYYSLFSFQEAEEINEIVLVTGQENIEYCKNEIVDAYNFTKVSQIVPGGRERYHSVYAGIRAAEKLFMEKNGGRYLFIHDGARPFVDHDMIVRCYEDARRYGASVAAMPVKDTIKVAGDDQIAEHTPDRSRLWQVQTPQVFEYLLIKEAYERLMENQAEASGVTDDAMVIEKLCGVKTRLTEGSYRNIKITTPEDLEIAKAWMKH